MLAWCMLKKLMSTAWNHNGKELKVRTHLHRHGLNSGLERLRVSMIKVNVCPKDLIHCFCPVTLINPADKPKDKPRKKKIKFLRERSHVFNTKFMPHAPWTDDASVCCAADKTRLFCWANRYFFYTQVCQYQVTICSLCAGDAWKKLFSLHIAGYMLWPTTVTQKSTCHEARVMTAYEATEKWVALLTWPERQQTPLSYTTNWTLTDFYNKPVNLVQKYISLLTRTTVKYMYAI